MLSSLLQSQKITGLLNWSKPQTKIVPICKTHTAKNTCRCNEELPQPAGPEMLVLYVRAVTVNEREIPTKSGLFKLVDRAGF